MASDPTPRETLERAGEALREGSAARTGSGALDGAIATHAWTLMGATLDSLSTRAATLGRACAEALCEAPPALARTVRRRARSETAIAPGAIRTSADAALARAFAGPVLDGREASAVAIARTTHLRAIGAGDRVDAERCIRSAQRAQRSAAPLEEALTQARAAYQRGDNTGVGAALGPACEACATLAPGADADQGAQAAARLAERHGDSERAAGRASTKDKDTLQR